MQADGSSAAQQQAEAVARSALAVTVSELDFPVDQYLVIGSPLGLFLALRKVDPTPHAGTSLLSNYRSALGTLSGPIFCDTIPFYTATLPLATTLTVPYSAKFVVSLYVSCQHLPGS